MNLDFFRSLHQIEFERKDRLSTRFDALVTVFTTLCGLLGFLVLNFKSQPGNDVSLWFWVLIIAAGAALAATAGFLIASSAVPHLEDIQRPSAWRTYRQALDEKYKAGKGTGASADDEFNDALIGKYIEATDTNIDSNTRRGYRIRDASIGLLLAFGLLVATFSTYYSSSVMPASEPASEVTKMLSTKDALFCAPVERFSASEVPGNRKVPARPPEPDQQPMPTPPGAH
jgi:hypothetical protein